MRRIPHVCLQVAALAAVFCVGTIRCAGQAESSASPADCAAYAAILLPPEAETVPVPKAAPSCASYRSYRGLGRPVNYAAARACAWQERLAQKANLGQNPKEPTAWIVGGSLILSDLYFNGAGVARNLPLAMRFACEADAETAKFALPEMLKADSFKKPFELCDFAATTLVGNFCTGYASEISDGRRSRYYDGLKSSMEPEQRAAFDKLLAAQKAYVEAHGFEVDQSGSIHTIRTILSGEILADLFRTELVHFERGKWPALSKSRIGSADNLLHREYQQTLQRVASTAKDRADLEAVTVDGLSKAQAAWERYGSAWDAFARLRYPSAASAIGAQITLDRYRLLKTMP